MGEYDGLIEQLSNGPTESYPRDTKTMAKAVDALTDLQTRLAAVEKERDNWKAHAISRGKRLRRVRDRFINICDGIKDEVDRVYFGSSNDADFFKEEVAWLDDFNWGKIMGEPENWDLLGALEKQKARAEAAEAALAKATEALEWYAENARLCRLIHAEGDKGRAALDADGGSRARAALAPMEKMEPAAGLEPTT